MRKENKKNKSLAYKIYSEQTINKYQKKINLFGREKTYSAIKFLNIRLLTSIVIFFVLLYIFEIGYIIAPIVTVAYFYFLPKLLIDKKLEDRGIRLDNDAMYFFEVLALSLETGKNLKNALELTANNIDSELAMEFRLALNEMKYGKSLNQLLDDLKLRIPSDTINNIILNITQSNTFGNSVNDTIHNQIDYIRDRQILRAKASISKIPLKVSVISVLFIIPLILLLILGPIIIQFLS